MLDILMVTYKSERFEKSAIQSIQDNTDFPARLTVLDNNITQKSLTSLWNDFALKSDGEFVCFANPDILCAKGWASKLMHAFSFPEIMIATPSTPVNPRTSSFPCSKRQALLVGGIFGEDGQVSTPGLDWVGSVVPPIIIDDVHAHAYLYCVRREWFLQVGLFDERFSHYSQEYDLNYRTILAGKRVVCVKNSVVFHFGNGSSGGSRTPELEQALQESMALLYKKHVEWSALFGVL
jgi:GT2 family glycosyltransferase